MGIQIIDSIWKIWLGVSQHNKEVPEKKLLQYLWSVLRKSFFPELKNFNVIMTELSCYKDLEKEATDFDYSYYTSSEVIFQNLHLHQQLINKVPGTVTIFF